MGSHIAYRVTIFLWHGVAVFPLQALLFILFCQAVHEAERELELIKLEAEKSREKLAEIKLMKREQEKAGAEEEDLVGVKCNFKELDDVLMRDVGDKIKNDGRYKH